MGWAAFPPRSKSSTPGLAVSDRARVLPRVGSGGLCKAVDMEHVVGVGGLFIRAENPAALAQWYRDCLGLAADENGVWQQHSGPTVFAAFDQASEYFSSTQQMMLNFRVRDLEAMLEQLRAKGANVAAEVQDVEGIGRFGWVTDPEGRRVELWQPS